MTFGKLVLASLALLTPDGRAQVFDTASIKPAKAGVRGYSIRPLPGRLSTSNTTLGMLVAEAYHVYDFQISGGPKWINTDRYDIEAKAEGETKPSEAQLRGMLQKLLAERFSLVVRRETRELPVYALEVGKGGPHFKASTDSEEAPMFRVFQRRQITAARAPLAYLVEALSFLVGRPVVDKTGLEGKYDYKLEWTPDETQVRSDEAAPQVEGNVPSLASALQEQMGLRLQSQKAPVEIVVIDRAEKASVN
ncbi:MAG TPA: TIGR03435 family protein [Candidatus Acidoferrales bacterium]|jgi:uncharacterized protein (TIGR03435 family)|nr:TIGR03435 family protein [Candidatus Acidoferrales bacterium]